MTPRPFSDQQSCHSFQAPYQGPGVGGWSRSGGPPAPVATSAHPWCSLTWGFCSALWGHALPPPHMQLWWALVWHELQWPPLQRAQAANSGGVPMTPSPLECRLHRPRGYGCLHLDFKGQLPGGALGSEPSPWRAMGPRRRGCRNMLASPVGDKATPVGPEGGALSQSLFLSPKV